MIEKAIKHLKNTFSKERIYRKKEDLDAMNEIITAFNQIGESNLKKNKLFIKLYINEFLRHSTLGGKNSSEALTEINRLLEIPIVEYYHKMQNEIPYLRFNALSGKLGIIPLIEQKDGCIKLNDDEETKKHNRGLIDKHQKTLTRALTTPYSKTEVKSFLDQHLFKTIIKYSNYD